MVIPYETELALSQSIDHDYKVDSYNDIDILREIGSAACLEQLAEEASELSKAALKMARIIRGDNPTPVTFETAYNNLVEEITDTKIACDCLKLQYDQNTYDYKTNRWKQRLYDHYMDNLK